MKKINFSENFRRYVSLLLSSHSLSLSLSLFLSLSPGSTSLKPKHRNVHLFAVERSSLYHIVGESDNLINITRFYQLMFYLSVWIIKSENNIFQKTNFIHLQMIPHAMQNWHILYHKVGNWLWPLSCSIT